MKVVMLMFDSLNRHTLSPYGCDWVKTPNFQRLAKRSVTFDQSWVCSMPCMPARRDLHTGRPNFFHTGWSPLQPWDDSVPEILRNSGISSHLLTDHYHYFEDGGMGYHTRYNTWQGFRGQESDPWMGQVAEPEIPPNLNGKGSRENWVNRPFASKEADSPQTLTINAGLDFIIRNYREDRWFVQIECFDPHEPFTAPEVYRKQYPHAGESPLFDWPAYDEVHETPEEIERVRHNYAALVSQCDANLGRILDAMDQHGIWEDTMLIVWTDHGFLLGEHHHWAKNIPAAWNEIARTPFFVWDPRFPKSAGSRRSALVQPAIDLGPTLLNFFGLKPTADMIGRDLAPVVEADAPIRRDAVFGLFGHPVHYTDGRYVYMRAVVDVEQPIHWYSWMPLHFRGRWSTKDMETVELCPPLPFTKNMRVVRRLHSSPNQSFSKHLLFDLKTDPSQMSPIENPELEKEIVQRLRQQMIACDAPKEMFVRYGV